MKTINQQTTTIIPQKSFILFLVLSFLTCGIYSFYFIYSVSRDTNTMCYGDGEYTRGLVGYIILTILTCGLYSLLWHYNLANRLNANIYKYGGTASENGLTFILFYIIGILVCFFCSFYAIYIIFKLFNKLAFLYNNSNN